MKVDTNAHSLIVQPPAGSDQAPLATNDIFGIKPPVDIPNGLEWLIWVGVAMLLMVAFGFLLWWLLRKTGRALPPPLPPPHVRARQRLQEALRLISDPRLFCIAVSDTLRVYLEERFQLRAPERTTEEFLLDLKRTSHLSTSQKESLAQFLDQCDLVKFARYEPSESSLRELHESALRLVDETQFDPVESTTP